MERIKLVMGGNFLLGARMVREVKVLLDGKMVARGYKMRSGLYCFLSDDAGFARNRFIEEAARRFC